MPSRFLNARWSSVKPKNDCAGRVTFRTRNGRDNLKLFSIPLTRFAATLAKPSRRANRVRGISSSDVSRYGVKAVFAVAIAVLLSGFHSAFARELRVCADPNNLPFSKADGTGFENRIAKVIADELGATVATTWAPQRRGFLRETLHAGRCDVVMGVPSSLKVLSRTRPYYRSSYVFVRRAGAPRIASFDDPALRSARIGVQLVGDDGANTPPVHNLGRRGVVANVRGFMVTGDAGGADPAAPVVEAVANGTVDVAIVWGPVAGYYAGRQAAPLAITPILFDPSHLDLPMTFDIAMGVRKYDAPLASELDGAIERRRSEIDAILASSDVPRTGHAAAAGR